MAARAVLELDGIEVALPHPDRVLFPDGLTKRDLADHYLRVAPVLLPHLQGRPVTVERFPRGIGAGGFFQRHPPAFAPPWLARTEVPLAAGGAVEHIAVARTVDLLWWVGQDAVAFHPFPVRADDPARPDLLILDLDPPEGLDPEAGFARTREVARLLLRLLDAARCPCFVKTTGSRGLHLVIPLRRGPGFAEVRAFARRVAEAAVAARPDLATLAVRRRERGARVFLDVARNAPAQSAVAPWSVRGLPGAAVAMPLAPEELDDPGLGPRRWTVRDVPARLAARGDPWAGFHARALPLDELEARFAAAHGG